jgi:hypothetical protein
MSDVIILERKLTDVEQALREAHEMDRRQQQLRSLHPSLYDEQLHNAGLSQAVQSVYTRLEDLLKDILTLSDGSVPASSSWHRDLLLQASTAVPGVRPEIISSETHRSLSDLLGFRHVVRSAYVSELRTIDVRRNADVMFDSLPRALQEVRAMCRAFFGEDARDDQGPWRTRPRP